MSRVALACVLVLLASASDASEPRFEPPAPGSYELPAIDRVREHDVLGVDGQPTRLLGLEPGEAAVVSFVYLSCSDACPMATSTLMRLDRELAKDPALVQRTRLVTASFDPERDTPKRMRSLREHVDPRSRWSFVTVGSAEAIQPVLDDFGQDAVRIPAGEDVPVSGVLRHVLKVFLVDELGDVRNIYSTDYLDVRLVLNDLRTILDLP
jgi:cytochrome oxidase Cu insertion factor (SCO1/SenC/PrrC family)